MVLLQELVYLIREHCPAPFCLGIKLNSGDYMRPDQGGLVPDEAIKTVEW